jgi:hypothetical protein
MARPLAIVDAFRNHRLLDARQRDHRMHRAGAPPSARTSSVFALALLRTKRTQPRLSVAGAMALWILGIVDWAASGRLRGGRSRLESLEIDHAPIRLVGGWLHGQKKLPEILGLRTWVGVAEFLALAMTLGYLFALLLRQVPSVEGASPKAELSPCPSQRRNP